MEDFLEEVIFELSAKDKKKLAQQKETLEYGRAFQNE